MKALQRLRAEQQLTLRELEDRSGVSAEAISAIERGTRKPQLLTLGKLARALDVDIEQLAEEQPSPKASAPTPSQGQHEEERRSLTVADFNAAETFSDVCSRLERFLDIADREPVSVPLLNMQHYLIRVAAGLSLPLMEKEAFRSLVLPTAARFVELVHRIEEQRESGAAVTQEEATQQRELVRKLTQRISNAA